MIRVVSGIIIDDSRLLVVRKEVGGLSKWIFPGGKLEEQEEDLVALVREIGEELPNLKLVGNFWQYTDFNDISPIRKKEIHLVSYMFQGRNNRDIMVSTRANETIKESRFCDYQQLTQLDCSDPTKTLINLLKLDSYL